jgi:hypothetical protein
MCKLVTPHLNPTATEHDTNIVFAPGTIKSKPPQPKRQQLQSTIQKLYLHRARLKQHDADIVFAPGTIEITPAQEAIAKEHDANIESAPGINEATP